MAIVAAPPSRSALDTTDRSLLHFLASRFLQDTHSHAPSAFKTAMWAALVTYLPLLIAASLTGRGIMTQPRAVPASAQVAAYTPPEAPVPLSTQPAARTAVCTQLRLPFLQDWNVMFMFVVTFPVLATLTVRDQCVLGSSIDRVRADGVLTLSDSEWNGLCAWWKRRFRSLNVLFQLCGLLTGAAVVWSNYATYVQPCVGYWIAPGGSLLGVGYLYFVCIFLFYFVTAIYILRNIAFAFFLRDLAAHSKISVLPLHPDRSGGLRPIGAVGLRNQYALTVVGLNVVILKYISVAYFPGLHSLTDLILAASVGYVLFSPPLFIGPLLPFRAAMLNTRTTLMNEVARRLRIELDAVLLQLPTGQISKQNEDMVDRLSKLGTIIDQLPVWPFDLRTMQKFLTAYIAPVVGAVLLELGKRWLEAGFIMSKLSPNMPH